MIFWLDHKWHLISFLCFPSNTLPKNNNVPNIIQSLVNISKQANKKDNRNFDVFLRKQKKKILRKQAILLCFVRIKKDLKTFKVLGLETVKDLSCAHWQLEPSQHYFPNLRSNIRKCLNVFALLLSWAA